MKKIYKVPVTWEAYSVIEVEAESPEEAIEIARDDAGLIEIPVNSEYVDGSWRVNVDSPEELILFTKEENNHWR